jgi:hypothetical protein
MSNINSGIDQEDFGRIDMKRGELTLPFTQDQFIDFVSSLFGKPERTSRFIKGAFEIEVGDIRDLHFRIEDRIIQQNKGVLVQFSSKIFYDDNSSVLLNSFESFSNYTETKNAISTKIEISWQYLIIFPDRKAPEKQEINVYIITDFDRPSFISEGFVVEIEYTARTWATDIDLMLNEHIKTLMKLPGKRSKISQFLSSKSENVAVVSGIIFFILSVLGSFISANNFIAKKIESTDEFLSNNLDLDTKINFLVNYIAGGEVVRFYFFLAIFLLLMLVASIFTGIFVHEKANFKSLGGYILLTKTAYKKRDYDIQSERNNLRNFLLSIIFAICINILSNYIFLYLTVR